ncbi:MetQ/NlpA family ABC transporter substrate-binding protein [Tetragenococcus koreensis]|uniref:MetQ/NlpA family ABC transporter substrate-binding protein n=1 Tax=Tetragenococcus koreensis TaxID=290335 RepID=UPI000F4DD241|nr:MetQ/NlpA family ABC transporter substrate-binding protein [Tetragenococcus koreensis]MDN6640805.1 MetQ/NlpA family ABC transporter substrate-binding protein [Tetragenococcus sp.]MDN6840222.1 MetQ/NlpA family ABC transporter substrate-binding protein [Tetragenococcus halophilus]AYW45544.1 metal ABC transporter substrate-binding protein [Tetragenococcus koreensis]MCF1618349.1 MetQ/NlpA family ABC transporter substrate-binding protein [Tetragenococcus koreensis]MCF1623136.1 MetQ/NlpA family A
MRKKKVIGSIVGVLSTTLLLAAGCSNGGESTEETNEIHVGTSPGPYSELFTDGIAPILEEQGYSVTATDFDELLQADIALNEGDIDVNVDQHEAYLEDFNKNNDANLTGLISIPTVPTGIYGGRKDALDEIEENDTVAIPDDASNTARALLVLEDAEWITLEEGVDPIVATSSNIAENPYNLDIVEMDSNQIPRSLEDIDYGVIPGSIVYNADIDASLSLLNEDILDEYELVVTVDEQNEDSEWAQAIVEAYQSDEFADYLEERNEDDYWFIPEDLQ